MLPVLSWQYQLPYFLFDQYDSFFYHNSIYLFIQNGSIIINIKDNDENIIAIINASKNCISSFILFSSSKLSNDLVSDVYVGDDKKIHVVKGGADSVLPFSGTLIAQEFSKTVFVNSGYQIPQTVIVSGVTYKYVGIKSLTLNSTLNSGGSYTISVSETGFVNINSPATSAVLRGMALYSI